MARLIIVFICIALVGAVAPWLIDEKGYILIAFGDYTVEGSIVSFVIMAALALFIGYLLLSLGRYIWNSLHNIRHGFFARAKERRQETLEQSMWALINDDMAQVKHLLTNTKMEPQWQDIAFAMQAKAELAEGEVAAAQKTLDGLSDANRAQPVALWLDAGCEAEVLTPLRQQCAKRKATGQQLSLFGKLLLNLSKYDEFAALVPRLVKAQCWNELQWDRALRAYFNSAGTSQAQIQQRYDELPRSIRDDVQTHYLRAMVKAGEIKQVEGELKKLLKRNEYSQLLSVLSEISGGDVNSTQQAVQNELKKQPDVAELLLCLAYLAQSQGEHDLASRIFDKVLAQGAPLPDSQRAMLSYKATGQAEKALLVLEHKG